jgi:2-haloalkanoic acid dehalogenase type II
MMNSIQEVLQRISTITFDCYGTLIEWRKGLGEAFTELLGPAVDGRIDELFQAYIPTEAALEAGPYQSYRQLLSAVTPQVAEQLGVDLPSERADLLADRLPDWVPFPDTNEALVRLKRRYRLGILSNIDRDLFAGTAGHFDVTFDFIVTAEDVQAYKPAHAHFERLLRNHSPRDSVLHVAQSLFHDGIPTHELGIPFVWINRYSEPNLTSVRPVATFSDLKSLADAAVSN